MRNLKVPARCLYSLLAAVFLLVVLLAIYVALPRIAAFTVSYLTGYRVILDEFQISKGHIKGIEVHGNDFVFRASQANLSGPFTGFLRNDFDEILLVEPSIHLVALSRGDTDLSFIKNLPRVRSLKIERGSVRLSESDSVYEISATDVKVKIQDYSPEGGGKMVFHLLCSVKNRAKGQVVVSGYISGNGIIKPYTGELALAGELEISLDKASSGLIAIGQSKARGRFVYEKKRLSLINLAFDASEITVKTDNKDFSLNFLTAVADIALDASRQELRFSRLSGSLKPLGTFNGDMYIRFAENYPFGCKLSISSVDIKALMVLLKPLLSDNLRQWTLSGNAVIETILNGYFKEGVPHIKGTASVVLAEGAFTSQDALKAGQGISGELLIDLKYPLKKKSLQVEIDVRLADGEYLWDRLYLNQNKRPIVIKTMLDLPSYEAEEKGILLETDLMSTGNYRVLVRGNRNLWRLSALLSASDIKGLHSKVMGDSLQAVYPFTKNMSVSGAVDLVIDATIGDGDYTVYGGIDLKGASVLFPTVDVELENISANMPVLISTSKDMSPSNNIGYLSIGTVRIKNVALKDIQMPLVSENNTITLSGPLKLDFLGGDLYLESLGAGIDLRDDLWLKSSFRLSETNIAPITEALVFGTFSGRLNSHIPNLKLKGKSISTEGQIEIDVFGGRVVISNIYGQIPLNYLGADIEFSDIDLEQLTETIKIGRITGIIRGSISNFEVQYGQVARFVMDIDSVPKEGVKQVVSTDAVENISILGTGYEGISRVLSTGINQFFKEFPYRKLGLRCTLDNDIFTIRGKILEGGKEYIIKRGLFRGIDVVNHNPENTISFKDMQMRLNTILQQKKKEG